MKVDFAATKIGSSESLRRGAAVCVTGEPDLSPHKRSCIQVGKHKQACGSPAVLGTEQHITKNDICFLTIMIKYSELQKFEKNKMFIPLCTQIGDLGEKLEGRSK